MDTVQDSGSSEANSSGRNDRLPEQGCSSSAVNSSVNNSSAPGSYRLFNRQRPICEIVGGGKVSFPLCISAADIMLWKRRQVSLAIILTATIAWILFERAGLSLVSVSSDVLLILVVVLFIRANGAVILNKQLQPLPELVLSEEMVNNAAAFFRVKINYMCLMAHDITLGKDFKAFFKVVFCLWVLSIIGSFFSFVTLAYIGTIFAVTVPALYSKYEERVDRYAGILHKEFSRQYRKVDDNIISRIPRTPSKNKDA